MKRRNATRSALFTSIISLLLCVSMLVGTTFAWFTDSVVSGTNVITAGNLDVELYHSKTKDFSAKNKVDGSTLLFTDKNGVEIIKHWEPGVIAYSNFQVANVGTLALTYRMSLVFDNMNTVTYEGKQYDLSDVLKVAIVEDGFEGDRAAAQGLDFDYTLDSFHLEGELEGNTRTETFGVVIYWEPGANEYDNIFNLNNGRTADDGSKELKVDLGINLFATQEEYEFDSFDDQYDKDADNTINAGETVRYEDPAQNIQESIVNNGTLVIEGGEVNNDSYALDNRGTASLKDVEVNAGNSTNYALITRGDDAVTDMNDVVLNAAGGGVAAADGAVVNFNSGSIDLNSKSTSGRYLFYAVGEGTTIVINGGDFDFDKTQNQKRAYIYAEAGTTVIVNGGNFGKASTRSGYTEGILGKGKVLIYGGTFKFDPTNWVAPGYEAEKSGDTWTVGPKVANAKDLVEELAAGNDIVLTDDLTVSKELISSNGYGATGINVKDGQTIDGGGNTLNINGAGNTWDSGICVTNGTIKNITVTGSFRGIFVKNNTEKVVLENVTTEGTVYTISCDQGANGGLEATGCTFNGWTSYAKTIGDVKFVGCTFSEGSGYAFCRPYAPTEFVGCVFEAGFQLDARNVVTFENCTIGDEPLTAENLATLVIGGIDNASVK